LKEKEFLLINQKNQYQNGNKKRNPRRSEYALFFKDYSRVEESFSR
jgi:hypothetical protein